MAVEQERNNYGIESLEASNSDREVDIAHISQKACELVESYLGKIIRTEIATGGLVSHVYKVTGEKQKGIVKIRGTHLAKLPQIPINPKDVDYEWSALQFLSQIEPSTFPQPLALDREASMILMTDIIPSGKTLEQRFEARDVKPEEIKDLGSTIARIHKKLAPSKESMRDGQDEQAYSSDLRRRLGCQENQESPALDKIIDRLADLPKQPILGDLAPKNIGWGRDGQITICDLESFYQGDLLFAYGYTAGHILLHTLDDAAISEDFVSNLLRGYQSEDNQTNFDNLLLKQIALGSTLYRLNNTIVPYSLSLSQEEKLKKATVAFELLEKESLSWHDLINSMISA